MSMPAAPPAARTSSPFTSMKGDHVGVRVPDINEAISWYTEKLDFRVVHRWPYGDLQLAYLAPAVDSTFKLELLAGRSRHKPHACVLRRSVGKPLRARTGSRLSRDDKQVWSPVSPVGRYSAPAAVTGSPDMRAQRTRSSQRFLARRRRATR